MLPIVGAKYKHYKSNGLDHIYEVICIAKHSETEELLVIYKPLYDVSQTRLGDCAFAARPLSMRFDDIEWNDLVTKRFMLCE